MTTIRRFEDIAAWKKARTLCRLVYDITKRSGLKRDHPLCNQMRPAAISIVSNIAEGFESQNNRTFIRYLYIAKASAGEIRAQTYIAKDQGYITAEIFDELYNLASETSRIIAGFISYLNQHLDQ